MAQSQADAKPPKEEIGVNGRSITAWLSAEVTREARSCATVTVEQVQQMCRQDPLSASLLSALIVPIQSTEWRLSQAQRGKGAKDTVQRLLTLPGIDGGLVKPFDEAIRDMAMTVRNGFTVLEKVFTIDETSGEVRLRKLAYRPPHTIRFEVDKHGECTNVIQKLAGGNVSIPRDRCVILTVNDSDNPYYGHSLFCAAHYCWVIRRKLYLIAGLAFALAAIPARIGKIPQRATGDQIKRFKEALESFGTNTSMTIPDGFIVEVFEGKRTLSDLMPFIQHLASITAQSVHAQWLQLGSEQARGGSYALADKQEGLSSLGTTAFLRMIAAAVNGQIIPDLCRYNSIPLARRPTFGFMPLGAEAIAFIEKNFQAITTAPDTAITPELRLEIEKILARHLGVENIDYDNLARQLGGAAKPAPPPDVQPNAEDVLCVDWVPFTAADGQRMFVARPKSSAAVRAARAKAEAKVIGHVTPPVTSILGELTDQLEEHLAGKHDVLARIIAQQTASTAKKSKRGAKAAQFDEVPGDLVNELFDGLNFGTPKEATDALLSATIDGYGVAAESTLKNLGISRSFRLRNRSIIGQLRERLNKVTGASDELFNQIRNAVQSGMVRGQNPITYARAIRQQFEDMNKASAERIARTESAVLLNKANSDVMHRSGADGEEWLTAHDDKVRPGHAKMHGEVRIFPNPFSNGDSYVAESDPYNDRCAGAPVVRDPDQLNPWDGN